MSVPYAISGRQTRDRNFQRRLERLRKMTVQRINAAPSKEGLEVQVKVKVEKITLFNRWNKWNQNSEECMCVTLMGVDSPTCYVTFTTPFTVFGMWVTKNENEECEIVGKFKRYQEYNEQEQTVLSHVKLCTQEKEHENIRANA